MRKERLFVLTIAGFDPSCGAGLTADLKTFEALHVYGLSVCTAITFQNEDEFEGINWIPVNDILRQMKILLRKYEVRFVKIGLIESLNVLESIVNYLLTYRNEIKIIWDPILKASAGYRFHSSIERILLEKILERIYLLIPNLNEAANLLPSGSPFSNAKLMSRFCNVYLKGGHGNDDEAEDILFYNREVHHLKGHRIAGAEKHGSGCVLSSAIAANLAKGQPLDEACADAKRYIERFLKSSKTLLGNHFLVPEGYNLQT